MKINVLMGSSLPMPPVLGGGVEKCWYALMKEMVKQGHEVTCISRTFTDQPNTETADGIRYLRVPGFDTPQSGLKLKLYDLIYSLRVIRKATKADINVTNSFFLPILMRRHKFGAVYVHVARFPKGQLKFYKHADRLQGVSEHVRQAIVEQCPEMARKAISIPNPLPASYIQDPRFGAHFQKEKIILYVGRVHPEKGLSELIQAYKLLNEEHQYDYRLVVLGPWEAKHGGGGEAYYNELQTLSQGLNVEWIGPVFGEDNLRDWYRRAEYVAYPSLADLGESFGLVPLEAMAHGAITVVSSLKCFQEFFVNGKNGIAFNHLDGNVVSNLATALSSALRLTESQKSSIIDQGYETSKKFAPEIVANMYLADFEKVKAGN